MFKHSLFVLALNSAGTDYDWQQKGIYNTPQACVYAEVDVLNAGGTAICRRFKIVDALDGNGHPIPEGMLVPDRDADGGPAEIIRPRPFERQPDIVIEVR